jgi:hypothetical protein
MAKITHKVEKKKIKKFHVLNCWMFSFEAEGFFCNVDFLYGGLGVGKLYILIFKKLIFFPAVSFLQFLVIKTLVPDRYSA